jgi:hypothetical protein
MTCVQSETRTTAAEGPPLQLEEIQGIVLRNRPSPCVGTYILLRVDDPSDGRQLMGRWPSWSTVLPTGGSQRYRRSSTSG